MAADYRIEFDDMLRGAAPLLALAPMQGITDGPFWKLLAPYGAADAYFTEYARVHATSNLHWTLRKAIEQNPTGRPVVAQIIGRDAASLARAARELQSLPVAGIDFNLGCPVPVVHRKGVGGGLLRDLRRVDDILKALRQAVAIRFTVKTRIGFDAADDFDRLLDLLARHPLDLVTVHGRTVSQLYRGAVRYDLIARAVAALPCPVLANGDIDSAAKADAVLHQTGARGIMVGRGAIRNPWIFRQIREHLAGQPVFLPRGREVLAYVQAIEGAFCRPDARELAQVELMKKYMNYLGVGVEPTGQFLDAIRRVKTKADFFRVCADHLDHDHPLPLEPFPGLLERPGRSKGGLASWCGR